MGDGDRGSLARLGARAETDPFFVAFALARYQALTGLDAVGLAAWLGCSLHDLPRLALCRRPDGGSTMFGDEVQRIAAYVDGDAGRLAHLLRTVENVEAMAGAPSGTLMAAQDREADAHADESTGGGPPAAPRTRPPEPPASGR